MKSLHLGADELREVNDAIDYFDRVCTRIAAISNYPHLRWIAGSAAVALLPTIVSGAIKAYELLGPLVERLRPTTGS
jgi:hypothetical protein